MPNQASKHVRAAQEAARKKAEQPKAPPPTPEVDQQPQVAAVPPPDMPDLTPEQIAAVQAGNVVPGPGNDAA